MNGWKVVVTGGSRGLGLAMTEALVARGAKVTVVARDAGRLEAVRGRLGVDVVQGDVTDPELPARVLEQVRPRVVLLNAGATPTVAPIQAQTWASFTGPWEVDVRSAFQWGQAALERLEPGSRVVIGSSGAGLHGSPLSGGYAGAKRMQMFLAAYLDGASAELKRGIKFQALVPLRIVADTELGRPAAEAYAARKGVSLQTFLEGFGTPMPPARMAELVVDLLTRPEYEQGVTFGVNGDGLRKLDG